MTFLKLNFTFKLIKAFFVGQLGLVALGHKVQVLGLVLLLVLVTERCTILILGYCKL